jgi:HSP20 family protein
MEPRLLFLNPERELRSAVYSDSYRPAQPYPVQAHSLRLTLSPLPLLVSSKCHEGGSYDRKQTRKIHEAIPVPYEEFESFPKHVEEFFDLIARRPFELLEKRPLLFGRDFEHIWKTEPELLRPIYLRLYETEENLVVRAEVPGFTEKDLSISCEPWRLVISGNKEIREEAKTERKEEMPLHAEKLHVFKAVKFPVEVKAVNVKATLKNGILEVTLPKAEVVKKVKIEVRSL